MNPSRITVSKTKFVRTFTIKTMWEHCSRPRKMSFLIWKSQIWPSIKVDLIWSMNEAGGYVDQDFCWTSPWLFYYSMVLCASIFRVGRFQIQKGNHQWNSSLIFILSVPSPPFLQQHARPYYLQSTGLRASSGMLSTTAFEGCIISDSKSVQESTLQKTSKIRLHPLSTCFQLLCANRLESLLFKT